MYNFAKEYTEDNDFGPDSVDYRRETVGKLQKMVGRWKR